MFFLKGDFQLDFEAALGWVSFPADGAVCSGDFAAG